MFLDEMISHGRHLARLATNFHDPEHCSLRHTPNSRRLRKHMQVDSLWKIGDMWHMTWEREEYLTPCSCVRSCGAWTKRQWDPKAGVRAAGDQSESVVPLRYWLAWFENRYQIPPSDSDSRTPTFLPSPCDVLDKDIYGMQTYNPHPKNLPARVSLRVCLICSIASRSQSLYSRSAFLTWENLSCLLSTSWMRRPSST